MWKSNTSDIVRWKQVDGFPRLIHLLNELYQCRIQAHICSFRLFFVFIMLAVVPFIAKTSAMIFSKGLIIFQMFVPPENRAVKEKSG